VIFRTIASACALMAATSVMAGDARIMVENAYARSSNPKVAAAFMNIMNHGADDDVLIDAVSDIAKRVELHTHIEQGDGIMKMVQVEDGIAVPSSGMAQLKRGGDHVMFMGLSNPIKDGDTISVTLIFEKAGEVTVDIPVDNARAPQPGAHGHGAGHKSN